MAVLIGVLTGLGLALSTGPIFLTLIKTSIDQGVKRTAFFIFGVSIADTTALLLTWFGLNNVEVATNGFWIGILGGFVLIGLGLSFIVKKKEEKNTPQSIEFSQNEHGAKLFLKGLSLNLLNPIVWGFWAAIAKYAISSFPLPFNQIIFFVSILLTILSTDFIKSYFAQKLTKFLKPNHVRYLNIGIGLLMIFFGAKLLFNAFTI